MSHDTPTVRGKVTPGADAIGGGDDSPETDVMKVCKACTQTAPDGAAFCPDCGEELVSIRRVPDMYLDEVVGKKYRIVEKIGQGGMGVVYMARNDALGQKVAVKFLAKKFADDQNLVLRFLNEAKSYCRVNHPNAVTLLDYGQHDDGALYIITEFIEGKNVTETLKDRGPLPADVVLDLGIQIAEVLSVAHGQGVIHRDLKPDNIMLMPLSRGRYAVKVLDFGIAKIVDEEEGPNTETGSVFGTPEFMSPEQARGDEADPRSDIYALGVILFYMITGKLPFRGKNKLVVLNMQLNEPPPRPREVHPEADIAARFESVIMKCLNKGRAQRYASADDLREALEELRVPGGAVTGRMGTKRESVVTPVLGTSTGAGSSWDEINAHDETLASIERRPADWEAESIEIARGTETGRGLAADRRGLPFGPLMVAIGSLIVLGLGWMTLGGTSGVSNDAGAPDETATAVQSSHRDALIASVEAMLGEGKLTEARAAFDHAPDSSGEDYRALRDRLAALEKASGTIERTLAAGNCDGARDLVNALEPGALRTRYEGALRGCKVPAAPARPTDAVEPTPAPQPPKPKAQPAATPPVPKPKPEPEPEPAKPDPSAEQPAESPPLPDDMALPPRTLE